MNSAAASGFVQGTPELHVTREGVHILNMTIAVEGDGPYLSIGYLLRPSEEPDAIAAGEKIAAWGVLRHRPGRGLFLAAQKIRVLAAADGRAVPASERRGYGYTMERRTPNGDAAHAVRA